MVLSTTSRMLLLFDISNRGFQKRVIHYREALTLLLPTHLVPCSLVKVKDTSVPLSSWSHISLPSPGVFWTVKQDRGSGKKGNQIPCIHFPSSWLDRTTLLINPRIYYYYSLSLVGRDGGSRWKKITHHWVSFLLPGQSVPIPEATLPIML